MYENISLQSRFTVQNAFLLLIFEAARMTEVNVADRKQKLLEKKTKLEESEVIFMKTFSRSSLYYYFFPILKIDIYITCLYRI